MKKIGIFFIGIFIFTMLIGCDKYIEKAQLVEVKFYNIDGKEIIGETGTIYRSRFESQSLKNSSNNIRQLNSMGPVIIYYYAKVNKGSKIKVVMKFKVNLNEMKSLNLKYNNGDLEGETQIDNIKKEGRFTYVTYIVENVTSESNDFRIKSWSDGNKTHVFSEKYGNKHVRGFYFVLNNSKNGL